MNWKFLQTTRVSLPILICIIRFLVVLPIHSTFIPAAKTGFTEQQAIHQSVMDQQHVDWPATEETPLMNLKQKGILLVHLRHYFQKD